MSAPITVEKLMSLMSSARVDSAQGLWVGRTGDDVTERRFSYRAPLCWRVEVDGELRIVSDGERSAASHGAGWSWVPADRSHHSTALRVMLQPFLAPLWGDPGTDEYRVTAVSPAGEGFVAAEFEPLPGVDLPPLAIQVDLGSGVIHRWSVPGTTRHFAELTLNSPLPDDLFTLPADALPDPSFSGL